MRKKTAARSLSVCTAVACLALAIPGVAATAAPSQGGYATFSGRLYSVKAISAGDVWAVGLTPGSSLIVHWNGSVWSQSLAGAGYFEGVAATSARDVWAVGGTNWFSPTQTFAEHWNGSSWGQVATPSPAGGGYLLGVAADSASDAWAVGLAGPGPGVPSPTTPLAEHWNGHRWTIQKVPVPAAGGELDGVAALSPSNVWAVGWTGPASEGTGQQTLIVHWNGRTWTRVPSPNAAGGSASVLNSVTAVSAGNAWAVGYYTAADGTHRTLSLYWNGAHWTVVPSQYPGGDGNLLGVAASWTHNIWAVGIRNPTRCGQGPNCKTLVEHWDGKRWTLIASPNPASSYLDMLWSISAVSRTDIWAVGTTDYASTLIIHWNGTSWS